MNYTKAIFLINKHARAIRCEYAPDGSGDKPKLFKTLRTDIRKDDLVVVQTKTRHNFTVVKVIEVDCDVDFDATDEMSWIVQKVAKDDFDQLLAQEADAIAAIRSAEMRQRREELARNLFKDQRETLKALPIAEMNGDNKGQEAQ